MPARTSSKVESQNLSSGVTLTCAECPRPPPTVSRNFIFSVNALLHIFILTTFLVIFYKIVVTKLESEAIESEIASALNKSLPAIFADLDTDAQDKLSPILHKLQDTGSLDKLEELYSEPDASTTSYNSWLFTACYLVVGALFIIIVTVFLLTWKFDVDIKLGGLLRENAALFLAIGLVELVFFLTIALKFAPAEPSYLNQQLVNALQDL